MTGALVVALALGADLSATFEPDATASWLLAPCAKVVVHGMPGAEDAAKAVRVAVVNSGRCVMVTPSVDAWSEGWTLEQELLVRAQLGVDSQLVVVKADAVVFYDGRGVVIDEVPYSAGSPLAASPRGAPKKPARPVTHFEATLSPAGVHFNPVLNQHAMLTVGFTYRPWWFIGFGPRVVGTYFFAADGPAKQAILVDRVEPLPNGFLRLDWAALVAVESAPLNFPIGPYVELAGGFGHTQHVINPGLGTVPVSFADSGIRPVLSLAAGVRWQPVRWFTVKVTLRDIITTGGAEVLNGCNTMDLKAADSALRAGQPVSSAAVGPSCNIGAFEKNDIPIAYSVTKLTDVPLTHLGTVDVTLGFAF